MESNRSAIHEDPHSSSTAFSLDFGGRTRLTLSSFQLLHSVLVHSVFLGGGDFFLFETIFFLLSFGKKAAYFFGQTKYFVFS